MTESLKLGGDEHSGPRIRRLNRLPVIVAILLMVIFLGVIFYGLSSRGLHFGSSNTVETASGSSASSYGDQLKQGIPDGIIGEPKPSPFQPAPAAEPAPTPNIAVDGTALQTRPKQPIQSDEEWQAQLKREEQQEIARELLRERMARVQASSAALDSPINVSLQNLGSKTQVGVSAPGSAATATSSGAPLDLYAAAAQAGLIGGQNTDPNGQASKETFLSQNVKDAGYLPNAVVPQTSPYELKRGSVIPATLITGINSDLPGRITAQVSQNVYDSATGQYLLIPQGSKLLGRYDSKVSFGQSRVLVIWTDIVFRNGSTLQIGGMAGTDAAGYGGFADQVDNHFFQTFGSAILVALIGAGTEMIMPQDTTSLSVQNDAENSARESFAQTFGEMSKQSLEKNMNVQPTLQIRPGYLFNVLVDQDIVFPNVDWGRILPP
jgi:type IV secretion system protein TrbI